MKIKISNMIMCFCAVLLGHIVANYMMNQDNLKLALVVSIFQALFGISLILSYRLFYSE